MLRALPGGPAEQEPGGRGIQVQPPGRKPLVRRQWQDAMHLAGHRAQRARAHTAVCLRRPWGPGALSAAQAPSTSWKQFLVLGSPLVHHAGGKQASNRHLQGHVARERRGCTGGQEQV